MTDTRVTTAFDFFTPEEQKATAELRLNSLVESIARQRDMAFTSAARADAELSVKQAQINLLAEKLSQQSSTLAKALSEIQTLKEENQHLAWANKGLQEKLAEVTTELDRVVLLRNESHAQIELPFELSN